MLVPVRGPVDNPGEAAAASRPRRRDARGRIRGWLLALWSVLRHGIAVYAWAVAAYAAAVLMHALTGANGLWVLAPASALAGFGALAWVWQGGEVRSPAWRALGVGAAAAGLVAAAAVGYARGLALAGEAGAPGLLVAAGLAGPVPVPVGAVLRAFTEVIVGPALLVATAGTLARRARGLPFGTGPAKAPTSLSGLVLDGLELLVWLIATPAAFLSGASLADTTPGLAQPAGALLAFAAVPLGAYGFLRILWSGAPTRDARTFVRKAVLVALLVPVGALVLRATLPALDSLRAAAGVMILAVWLAACGVMCAVRCRPGRPGS